MLKELIRKVAGHEADDRASAEDRYAALLEAGKDDPKSVAELRAVMAQIGKTASDAANDDQVIDRARTLQSTIDRGCNLSKPLESAVKERDEFSAETDRILAERQQRQLELYNVAAAIADRRGNGKLAEGELRELARKHPALLRRVGVLQFQD